MRRWRKFGAPFADFAAPGAFFRMGRESAGFW
jgi:hypothetical protein